jgi:hypothetical protein
VNGDTCVTGKIMTDWFTVARLPVMKHRNLGRSGLKVSEVAYGNWISYTEREAMAIARAALECGVTTFDQG